MPCLPEQLQVLVDADGDVLLSNSSRSSISDPHPPSIPLSLPHTNIPVKSGSAPVSLTKHESITASLPVDMSTANSPTPSPRIPTLDRSAVRTGARRAVSGAGSLESSPRSDFELGSGSDGEVRGAYDAGKGPCRRRRLRGQGAGERPYKRARVGDGAVDADVDVDVSMSGSRSGSASGEDGDTQERERRREEKARTRERETMSMPMPMPASPLPRPSPARFQSSSSSSSSSSPFPTTPPSNGSFSPNAAFMPQPFWFDDGDLVLLVSPPPVRSPAPTSTSTSLSVWTSSQSSHPPFPSSFFPSFSYSSSSNVHPTQDSPPPTTTAFRIHAARLALASAAFASLLSSPLPTSPSREDSARAAREIAERLAPRNRSEAQNGSNMKSKFGVGYAEKGVHAGRAREDEDKYECVGGCPAIRLEGDAPRDWVVTLEAIYEPMSFQIRPVVFDTLAGALRVSTRYGARQLREWALAQLRTTWPNNVERMAPMALPHAADAIALARACDVPDILPAAFYALAVQRWRPSPSHSPGPGTIPGSGSGSVFGSRSPGFPGGSISSSNYGSGIDVEAGGTDGGRAHTVLSRSDMRRLVAGREALQDVLVEIVASPLAVGGSMWAGDEAGGGEIGEMMITTTNGNSDVNGNATYPPSPAPSPSPKTSVLTSASTLTSPTLSNASDATSTTMVSVSVSSTFHQPSPAPVHHFSSFSSFSSSSPASTSASVPSSTASFGFSPGLGSAKTLPSTYTSSITSSPHFTFCSPGSAPCRGALEALWRARLVPDGRRAWGTWLARELHRLATLPRAQFVFQHRAGAGYGFGCEDVGYGCGAGYGGYGSTAAAEESGVNGNENESGNGGGGNVNANTNTNTKGQGQGQGQAPVCVRCWEENRRLALWRLDWLCAAIPGMFML